MRSKSKTCGEEKHNQNLKLASAIDFVLVLYLKLEGYKDEGYKDGDEKQGGSEVRQIGTRLTAGVVGAARLSSAVFVGLQLHATASS